MPKGKRSLAGFRSRVWMGAMRQGWQWLKRWKRWGIASGVLAGLGLLGLVVMLAPVDRRPWSETAHAEVAGDRLQQVAETMAGRGQQGPWRVGWSRMDLTPMVGEASDVPERGEFRALPLAGYGDRQGRPATGVHDGLWAKAIAFASGGRTGVVVTADLLIIPRWVAEGVGQAVEDATGLGRDRIYFGATHTHSGPGGWGQGWVEEAFAGGYQPSVRPWLVRQLAGAAVEAVQALQPASLGVTEFRAPELVRNRLVGDEGRVDDRFHLVSVRSAAGERAVMGAYAAHSTVLSGRHMTFSGDYPGFWQRAVEAETGAMALFLGGAMGSHGPRVPEGGMDGARRMGESLAARTVTALGGVMYEEQAEFGWLDMTVPLPPLQVRLTDGLRLREWLARKVLPVGWETRLQAMRLGSAVWVSTPCDYSGELALDLQASVADLGVTVVPTSFNGDYVGYVVPTAYYGWNTYETRVMSFFGPQWPEAMQALMEGMVRAVVER